MPPVTPTPYTQSADALEPADFVAELRAAIHRATVGHASGDEGERRQAFGDGLLVSESSMSRWAALGQVPTAPMPL